eukprot:scaffold78905_cov32-Prasinocladus_malaysianus.AAC.1
MRKPLSQQLKPGIEQQARLAALELLRSIGSEGQSALRSVAGAGAAAQMQAAVEQAQQVCAHHWSPANSRYLSHYISISAVSHCEFFLKTANGALIY